jgi:hypothetical protein
MRIHEKSSNAGYTRDMEIENSSGPLGAEEATNPTGNFI